jgi:hypothetical protein
MPKIMTSSPRSRRCLPTRRLRLLRTAIAICAALLFHAAAADGLRVDNPAEVSFVVTDMTAIARKIGLSRADLADMVTDKLSVVGISARPTIAERDEEVLLVDVVVEHETFYVSLGFWRVASYPQPQGEITSGFVAVWQDYSVGTHHGNVDTVYDTVTTIVDQFITRYSDANDLAGRVRVATSP